MIAPATTWPMLRLASIAQSFVLCFAIDCGPVIQYCYDASLRLAPATCYNRLTMIELSDLIPLWCEGIDPAFWTTKRGKCFAEKLWTQNCHDAMTINKAYRLIYGRRPNPHVYVMISHSVPIYPIPDSAINMLNRSYGLQAKYYVLLRDMKLFFSERTKQF